MGPYNDYLQRWPQQFIPSSKVCATPPIKKQFHLPFILAWSCDLLCPVEYGRSDTVTSLMRSCSFHSHSLGMCLPLDKEALHTETTWRERPPGGELRYLSQWPAPGRQSCEGGHLGCFSPVGLPHPIPCGPETNSAGWALFKFLAHRTVSNPMVMASSC